MDDPVFFEFNSHKLEFNDTEGGTGPGEILRGEFAPGSYVHSLHLLGPEAGEWAIDSFSVELACMGSDPYEMNYGAVVLNDANKVNLWRAKPLPVFDV